MEPILLIEAFGLVCILVGALVRRNDRDLSQLLWAAAIGFFLVAAAGHFLDAFR